MVQPYMIKKYILCVTTLQCNICPTITLTHGSSSYSEMIWTQGFFKNLIVWGWASRKRDHTILSVERRQMVIGDKKFGVVSYALVGGLGVFSPREFFVFFSTLGLKCEHFLKQIFGYTALHCALIDQIWSVKCTYMVCLCKYHNWVTQGVGSLLNLVGPTPTRRYHGWRRAGKFWTFWVSRLLELAFSESSFWYLWL
jgi:hypothetical protein